MKALGRFRHRLALSPFGSEARLEGGDPSDGILRAADRDGADLIGIGTRGRSGLERLLIGGVARTPRPGHALPASGRPSAVGAPGSATHEFEGMGEGTLRPRAGAPSPRRPPVEE
ncbi:MAG: universal stress protein [Planctomycetota bacterium]